MESMKREWSDGATSSLPDAYEAKWNKRNKVNLRLDDWEEVSVAVSSRCNGSKRPETSTQCKHKIEGMKKRYRLEAMDLSTLHRNGPSSWPFFAHMDSLLHSSNKSVLDVLPGGLDPGALGLGLGSSVPRHNSCVDQSPLHGEDADCRKQASLCHDATEFGKPVPLRADDDGAAPVLSVDNAWQAPFSHLQILQGYEDLCRHASFPEEETQGGEEEDGFQEAESKHESMSQTLLDRKTEIETSVHGYKLARPHLVDAVDTVLANEAARADRKPCAEQKKHTHKEVWTSIRTFTESILNLERAKMEMYKDTERLRAEAEARRAEYELRHMQMIMNTQLEIAKLLASKSNSITKKNVRKKMKIKKKKKETNDPPENGVMSMDAEPLPAAGSEEMPNVEAIPSSQSASGMV